MSYPTDKSTHKVPPHRLPPLTKRFSSVSLPSQAGLLTEYFLSAPSLPLPHMQVFSQSASSVSAPLPENRCKATQEVLRQRLSLLAKRFPIVSHPSHASLLTKCFLDVSPPLLADRNSVQRHRHLYPLQSLCTSNNLRSSLIYCILLHGLQSALSETLRTESLSIITLISETSWPLEQTGATQRSSSLEFFQSRGVATFSTGSRMSCQSQGFFNFGGIATFCTGSKLTQPG